MKRAQARRLDLREPRLETDPDLLARYLQDAAHYPGGFAAALARPSSVAEVAAVVAHARRVIPVGAQSSLTGGATPRGDVVISTERMQAIEIDGSRVRCGAGVTLIALQERLAAHGLWFPPVPTYLGATVGGAVATNAAGAATFKYGPVRDWISGISVVLASGDLLEVTRGDVRAGDGVFEIEIGGTITRVPAPAYAMPDVPKCSAGYYAWPEMDLIDLFIGSEGTLGVIADATLRAAPLPAATCSALIPAADTGRAIALVDDLRRAAREAWDSGGATGVDISAIEHMDRRSLEIIRDDGVARRLNIPVADTTGVLLLAQIELTAQEASRDLWADLADARTAAADTSLLRFCRLLDRHGVLDETEIALPGDAARAAVFVELRESVPAGVNQRVARAKSHDERISKTAADMIVPFARLGELMAAADELFARRRLDVAVWGHISDGNLHPNVLPRTHDDVISGREAVLELGRLVVVLGGSPLAEHGVGRNPVKQQLLRLLYGDAGLASMRLTRKSLDPDGKLSAGVLFAT